MPPTSLSPALCEVGGCVLETKDSFSSALFEVKCDFRGNRDLASLYFRFEGHLRSKSDLPSIICG